MSDHKSFSHIAQKTESEPNVHQLMKEYKMLIPHKGREM